MVINQALALDVEATVIVNGRNLHQLITTFEVIFAKEAFFG